MASFEQIRISTTASGYQLSADQLNFACVIGRSGMVPAQQKAEGDGATPIGDWPVRCLYYRPDRIAEDQIRKLSQLPCRPITPQMGWVDDPESALYNRPVMLPCADRHEQLWREDGLYDLILPLGYNDGPIQEVPFFCAEPHTTATEGRLTCSACFLAPTIDPLSLTVYEHNSDRRMC